MQRAIRRKRWLGAVLGLGMLLFLLVGNAQAAEFVDGGSAYRLAASEIVADDLYVTAGEIIIDGTIDGDLLAAGAYVEVNGTVTGDIMAAGATIFIHGTVGDDVRAAGAEIDIFGTIGGDLILSGGGGVPFPIGERTVNPGVRIANNAEIAGDVAVFGSHGVLEGTIGGNLVASMGDLTLAAHVGGDANLDAETVHVHDIAQVDGTLRYTSSAPVPALEALAEDVEYTQKETKKTQPNPIAQVAGWAIRTVVIIAGFALLGGLLLRVTPGLLERPSQALASSPAKAFLYGLLATVLFILLPVASVLLVFLMVLFWGVLPGIILGVFLFAALALIWILSPLVTGFWLGKWLVAATGRDLSVWATLVVGIMLLVLLGRIPFLGYIVYLMSFLFALGGLWLSRQPEHAAQ